MRGVRVVFVGYLVVIVLGIAYVTALATDGPMSRRRSTASCGPTR